jgi:hypothetical protein
MKKKLFLAKEQSNLPEYKILHGIHPFNSKQIMSFKMSYATRPINDAGYYTIQVDENTRYVFKSQEKDLAEKFLSDLAKNRFQLAIQSNGLEGIDLTIEQSQPKCKEDQVIAIATLSGARIQRRGFYNR